MEFKPIVTYSGAGPLFRSLEAHIVASIPLDTCEWKRSYGRPVKDVHLDASFQTFNAKLLDDYKQGNWSILEHPVLHLYVTECNDVDTYKSTVKEDIDGWLKVLNGYGIVDWMILVVETIDVKKTKNILPRTTVLDKIRTDFASKHGDRCISVLNPMKFEIKATESYRCFLQRIRLLMLNGYNRNINKYEELIRANRETRNQEGWCFVKYFLLQEELAFVLEMLGLHSEALIQYDELDAMFSQFILNSVFGEKPKWLKIFQKPFSSFHGITMNNRRMLKEIRLKIQDKSITLLEFRSYMFERQSIILNAAGKTSEIAERLLPFLFSTLRELEALKIEMIDGALDCWEFVCALEVLDVCETAIEAKDTDDIFKQSAPIWNLAKDKLYQLGKLCGLLPGSTPTSEQLHIVVQLSAGMGDGDEDNNQLGLDNNAKEQLIEQRAISPNRKPKRSATDRLKEALGSNYSFQRLYLELCELTISTNKHVSRLRSARLIGLDLGNFYCNLSEPNKAVGFFTDLMRELKRENWHYLASQTLLELANCYRKMEDMLAYTKTCAAISCSTELEILVRRYYFDEFIKSIKVTSSKLNVVIDANSSNPNQSSNMTSLEDHFKIVDIQLEHKGQIIQDTIFNVSLSIDCNFPKEILANKIALSFETLNTKANQEANIIDLINSPILPITTHLDYKQDNSLNCASVVCDNAKSKQPVRRSSSTRRKVSLTTRNDFTNNVSTENVQLQPGLNTVQLSTKATRVGLWSFKQLSIEIDQIEFLSEMLPVKCEPFEITTKAASANLSFKNLIAGIEQTVDLIISSGSFIFPKEAIITIKCSKHLKIRPIIEDDDDDDDDENVEAINTNVQSPLHKFLDKFQSEILVKLTNVKSFEERTIQLAVLCDLPGQRDEKLIEQRISLQCPWSRSEIQIPLSFMPAMVASCRLHSSGSKKFLQVMVKGLEAQLKLTDVTMTCEYKGVTLHDRNPKSKNNYVTHKSRIISYLWEIEVEPLKAEGELSMIKVNFALNYAYMSIDGIVSPIQKHYHCKFDVTDYTTLFRIEAKIEPSELCRVRSVYNLILKVIKIQDNPHVDLMYEVLADQNIWAVVGRTAGVISMVDREAQTVSVEVLPLSTGFLPLPNIRLSKYISADKNEIVAQPKLQPFAPGQIYNSTKSIQIHVLAASANNNNE